MNDTRIPLPPLNLVRRRILPLASTAAALGLAGCAIGGGSAAEAPAALEPPVAVLSPQQRAAQELVRQYTDNLDVALDRVDRERLRAAAEKKITPPAPTASSQTAPPSAGALTAIPASAAASGAGTALPANSGVNASPPDAAEPSAGESVILASSTSQETSQTPPAPPAPARTMASATTPEAVLEKSAALRPPSATLPSARPAMPLSPVAPAITTPPGTVSATPVSTQTPSAVVITPIAVPPSSTPSAMGAMTAAIAGAAPAPTTPIIAPVASPAPEPSLEEALGILRKQVSTKPTFNSALALALLNPADSQAAELAKTLPEADQAVFTDLLTALQGMNSATGSTAADRAAPLLDAARKWQADADLALPKLVLATRVDSFGVYNAVEPRFEQGRRHTVIIYCEVANFSSSKSDDGWYQTRLSQQETLITDDGLLVWRPNAEEVEDRSMNQRRDFYLVKKLTIPENLAAGKYTLRMTVTDRNTNRISMVSLPIEILVR